MITTSGAIDTELGILKTGKEADVFLVERNDPCPCGSGKKYKHCHGKLG